MLSLKQIKIINLATHKDSTYDFQENKLSIINGINLDTAPFQYSIFSVEEIIKEVLEHFELKLPSNGSGKSAVLEGINLVCFGESVRKGVNARDLIRKGEDYLRIELLCSNDWLNLPKITITRTIFLNKSKTQILEVKEGIKPIEKPSIEILNKYILDHYIGISKEDIINFFMIQKDRYKPFLLLSDTQKKEMISRFTGIDKYNYIELELNKSITNKSQELKEEELKKATIEGKIELSQEDIDKLPKEKDFAIFIKEKTDLINLDINKLNLDIEDNDKEIKKIDTFRQKKLKLKEHWGQREINYNNLKNPYKLKLDEIATDKKEIKELFNSKDSELTLIRKTKQKQSLQISELEGFQSKTTKCPDCNFEFSLSTTKSLKEIKQEILNLKGEYQKSCKVEKEILEDLYEIESTELIIKKEEILQEKKSKRFKDIGIFIERLARINSNQSRDLEVNIQDIIKENTKIKNKIEIFKQNILDIKKGTYSDILEQKKNKEEALDLLNTDKKIIEGKILTLSKSIQNYKDALIVYNNFKNYLYKKTIFTIEQIVNYYLSKFNNLVIKIKADKTLADGKTQRDEINVEVERNNKDFSYYLLSSGEKTAIDTSFILAFQQIINGNSQNGLNYICLDEVISSVDPFNATELCKVLNTLNKTINIISHVPILGKFDINYIVKKNETSNIVTI